MSSDDYWFDQRYQAMYYSIHEHHSWESCPETCIGRKRDEQAHEGLPCNDQRETH